VKNCREHEFIRKPLFGEALLLNADADWTALTPDRPMHLLSELSARVHVYSHASDDALLISELTKNDR